MPTSCGQSKQLGFWDSAVAPSPNCPGSLGGQAPGAEGGRAWTGLSGQPSCSLSAGYEPVVCPATAKHRLVRSSLRSLMWVLLTPPSCRVGGTSPSTPLSSVPGSCGLGRPRTGEREKRRLHFVGCPRSHFSDVPRSSPKRRENTELARPCTSVERGPDAGRGLGF